MQMDCAQIDCPKTCLDAKLIQRRPGARSELEPWARPFRYGLTPTNGWTEGAEALPVAVDCTMVMPA